MGNGLAIPHGTNEAKSADPAHRDLVRALPDGIDWNGKQVKFVVGIAGAGDDHLPLLGKIGKVFVDRDAGRRSSRRPSPSGTSQRSSVQVSTASSASR